MPRPLILRFDVDDRGARKVKGIERGLKGMGRELDRTGKRSGAFGRALSKLTGPIRAVTRALTSFKALLIGAGVTAGVVLFTKSVINAASVVEQLKLRLVAATGSQEEANRVFDDAAGFAASVAFEYEEIISSATQLQIALNTSSEETLRNIKLVADLAAFSGLTLNQVEQQLIRSFTAGIGSADLFRERGVVAMLGFQAGATFSAKETKKVIIAAWEDIDSRFRGLSEDMAGTFKGIMSQLRDRWFQFRLIVGDAGLFDATKDALSGLNEGLVEFLENNEIAITEFVQGISAGIKDIDIDALLEKFRGLGFELSAAGQTGFRVREFNNDILNFLDEATLRTRILGREILIAGDLGGTQSNAFSLFRDILSERIRTLGAGEKSLAQIGKETLEAAAVTELTEILSRAFAKLGGASVELTANQKRQAAQQEDINALSLIGVDRANALATAVEETTEKFARRDELGGPISVFPSEQVVAGFNRGLRTAADLTEDLTAKAQKLTDVFKQAAQAASLDVKIIGLEERAGLVSRVDAIKERFEIEKNLLRVEQDSLIAQGDAAETDKARLDINAKLFAISDQMAFTVRAHELEISIALTEEEKKRLEELKRILKIIQDTAEAQRKEREEELATQQRHFEQRLDIASNFFTSFGDLSRAAFEASGEDAKGFFAAFKALAIAGALIDTYASAVKAYNRALELPIVGLPLAPIAAAAAIAAGLANVARISGVSFHQGGLIGGNEDEQLINARRGEFVIRAPIVEKIGVPTLRRLNKGTDLAGSRTRSFIDNAVGDGMGRLTGGAGVQAQAVQPVINKIQVTIFDTQEGFNNRLRDPEAEEIVVQYFRENEDTGGARANF